MGFFSNLSIKQKFRTLMIAISSAGLLVAVIAFLITDIWRMKENMVKDVRALAEVIAKDVSVAIAFDDQLAAADTLSALENQPLVLSACIFTNQTYAFAGFRSPNLTPAPCRYQTMEKSWRWTGRDMSLHHPIVMDREQLGTLVINYSLAPVKERLGQYALISFIILVLSISCVFVFSFIIERIFLAPIMNLKNTAENISLHHDHTIRAQKESPDEIGVLVDSFNRMLDVIQDHEKAREQYQQSLEQTVADRTGELQQRNQEVEKANRRLEAAVRHAKAMATEAVTANAYKSQFVANISHEIRTPLNAILGFSDLLNSKTHRNEQERYYLDTIATAGKTLLSLIDDILDLSKIEAGKLELDYANIDLRALIWDVERLFSQQLKSKGLDFDLDIDPDLPTGLLLDEQRLRQILVNLLGNAIKFTETGGVGLAVRALPATDDHKTDIELRIRDSGIGIADQAQAAIFEAFQQQPGQDSKYGGTGLGLAISNRLVTLMNGDIAVKSAMGKGTTFTVVLREVGLTRTPAPPTAQTDIDAGIRFYPANILIADDIRINRVLIKEYLQKYRFDLLEARDGQETIDIASKNRIDLLLLDIKMPRMDGYQAAKAIKSDPALAAIPIIAVTASIPSTDADAMKCNGFDGYLLKPVNQLQLLTELKRFLPFRDAEASQTSSGQSGLSSHSEAQMQRRLADASPELWTRLSELMQDRLESARRTMLATDLSHLAAGIGAIGREHGAEWLIRWSSQLQQAVAHFDVAGMLRGLDRLEKMKKHMDTVNGKRNDQS